MVKNLPANAGDARDVGSISWLGRCPGGRHGKPLQYSCLGNPIDRGAWWEAVYGVAQSQTRLKQHSSSSSSNVMGFPGGASRKEHDCQCRRCKRCGFDPWVWKIPWRKAWQATPVFLGFPYGSVGKESVCNVGDLGSVPGLGRSPGGGHGNPLQYSCLENPWTEEPGRLQSIGWQRVGHN